MVKICDAIMGSGKTSATINYINSHPEKKFLYISPYTNEAARIKASCPDAHFVEPSKKLKEFGFSKSAHSMDLIRQGRNIASTHQALVYYKPETFDMLQDQGYTVIVDEAPNILTQDPHIKYGDVQLLIESGHAYEHSPLEFRLTGKEYLGERMKHIYRTMQSRPLVYTKTKKDGTMYKNAIPWYWAFSTMLFERVENVIILTYLFDRQEVGTYMDMNHIPYQKIGIKYDGETYDFSEDSLYVPEYVKDLPNKVHIAEGRTINNVGDNQFALSKSWHDKHVDDDENKGLKNGILNFFQHYGKCPSSKRMVGTYAESWKNIKDDRYKKAGVVFNERSTNEYKDRVSLAYVVNVYANANVVNFYQRHGYEFDNDGYALTTMIQWVWRSAIRDGKDINLYIPSSRMRKLFTDWLQEVSA